MKPMGSIVVFGAGGHMGKPYIRALLAWGVPLEYIIAIEPDKERRMEVGEEFYVYSVPTLDVVPRTQIDAAIVAVPSPLHLSVFKECAARGIRTVFTEKPTVSNFRDFVELEKLNLDLLTGYLINFSPAVDEVCKFIHTQDLHCREGVSIWGKNWPGCDRWMGPDLEEETVHPLTTFMRIIGARSIKQATRWFNGSWVSHLRPELIQPGEVPQDTTSGKVRFILDDGSQADLHVVSSFNLAFQDRTIDLVLAGPDDKNAPQFKARLEFDVQVDGRMVDRLRVIEARSNKMVFENSWVVNKVQVQLNAFLNSISSGIIDERLVDVPWALDIHEILHGALDPSK